MAREQWRFAQEHIEDQALVGFRGGLGEGVAVAEVHGDIADFHLGAWHLRGDADGGALIWLDADHKGVLAELVGIVVAEEQVRGLLEDHGDLGDAASQALAGTQSHRRVLMFKRTAA